MRLDPQVKERLKKAFSDELTLKKEAVVVYSTYHLSEADILKMKKQLPQFAHRTIENKIDPTLIGGIVVQSGSQLIDLSIRNALHLLKKQLYESN